MADIQTEMIMNSDSSNIVSDILNELNHSDRQKEHIHQKLDDNMKVRMQEQMRQSSQQIPSQHMPQDNSMLNENAVINQYDNTEISNEMQLNRQMDPTMNLNPNVRLDMRDQQNMNTLPPSPPMNIAGNSVFGLSTLLTRRAVIYAIKMLKNIVILCAIVLLFLSPIATKLSVKVLPRLYASSSSQIFKWIGLLLKSLTISILYNVIYIFV
tara:strand:- start:39 stop:671 length:633 start_codon:yes stop_codon:yes gene_type:complete